jgi:hypothetical protein
MAELGDKKCIIVINAELEPGIIANTTACLGFSLGSALPHEVGPTQKDADGVLHGGLVNIPVPILSASAAQVKEIVDRAYQTDGLIVFDMSDKAQLSKTQEEYGTAIAETKNADLKYWGVALYGDKKIINKQCGSLPLFRG